MKNEEVYIINKFISCKDIDGLKSYRSSLDFLRESEERQKVFEEYLMEPHNYKLPLLFKDPEDNSLFFSNGVSFYYLNPNYVNLKTPKLIKHHPYQNITVEYAERIQQKTEALITRLVSADWISPIKSCTYVENETLYQDVFHVFQTSEVQYLEQIIGAKKYLIGATNPVLYAESEVGRAYVLGYTQKRND